MVQLLQLIIVLFVFFTLSRTLLRFKDKKINFGELLFWTLLWTFVVIFSLVPDLLSSITVLIGISRPLDFATYSSVLLLFYLIFRLYIKQETTNQDVTKLTREIAMLSLKKVKKWNSPYIDWLTKLLVAH